MNRLRIGTRSSPLALWQANYVADRLRAVAPDCEVELIHIRTTGDVDRTTPLTQIGGEGLFTKEIQRALLDHIVDLAVHSLKDLPTIPVDGLTLAAVPPRAPTEDALVSVRHRGFDDLPSGAVVATSSLRRRALMLHRRPDLRLVEIRGNVETRLRKLEDENLDATVLAHAGLQRLGLADRITEILDPAWMLPAVGQGALGLECRADDADSLALVSLLDDLPTRQAVLSERAFLRGMGGGCQVPMAAAAHLSERLTLRAVVLPPDGTKKLEAIHQGQPDDAEAIGEQVAAMLLDQGAGELLR